MCGLFGVIGKNGYVAGLIESLRQLTFFSVFRGADSTGYGAVDAKKRTYLIEKAACASPDFLERRGAISVLTDSNNYSVILGHTRAATRGSVSKLNAHPFYEEGKYGSILLTHNGFAEGYDAKEYNVDSQWVCAMIAEHGPEWVKKLRGEYALVWHDFRTNSTWAARNNGRPLFIADVPAGAGMIKRVYASEKEMLACALSRNKVPISQMYELAPHALHEFDSNTAQLLRKEVYEPPAPVYNNYNYGNAGWQRGNAAPAVVSSTANSVLPGAGSMYRQGATCQIPAATAWDKAKAADPLLRTKIRVKLKNFNASESKTKGTTHWEFAPDPTDELYRAVPQIRMSTITPGTNWVNAQILKDNGWLTLEIMAAEWVGAEANKKLVTLYCMVPDDAWQTRIKNDDVVRDLPEPVLSQAEVVYDEDEAEELLNRAFLRGA